jgi:hypothetical protein
VFFVLLRLIVIWWCSTRLCFWSYPFHNQCPFHCFDCIMSRRHSTTVRGRLATLPLHFPRISTSRCSLHNRVSSLHSWFLHNGLVLNPTETGAMCLGHNSWLESLSCVTSIEVAGSSVTLSNHVKLVGVKFDKHLNCDHHISNVCSSSYVRALRQCYCWLQTRLCQFSSHQHFCAHLAPFDTLRCQGSQKGAVRHPKVTWGAT